MPSSSLRREIKFALPEGDLPALRSILDTNCRRVRYVGDTSRVTSLYFDDARLSACHDNIEGSPRRSKVRLRWYDAELPSGGHRLFLERKWKDGEATGKDRSELTLSAGLGELPFHALAGELQRSASGTFREAVAARRDPVVIVDYERTYYEAVGAPLRITLDGDLAFYLQLGSRFADRRFAARAGGLVIVEGKTPVGEEGRLASLLRPLSPRVSRSSKYVLACQAVGLLPGSGYRV